MSTAPSSSPLLQGEHFRITPITPRVVRLEWSQSGRFEDRPSVFGLHRELRDETARVSETATGVRVETSQYVLDYDRRPFSANGLSLTVLGGVSNYHSVWRYGQDLSLAAHVTARRQGRAVKALDGNLGGTTRTLDEADGAVDLDPGVNSTVGYAVIDDSHSMVLDDGRLTARGAEPGAIDLYVFAAGRDHVGAVRDLFAISGPQPLVPRWALGNWWSRYHPYTEQSYLELLDRFDDEGVPLSVAVIDMDWHLTDVDPAHGSGWTGYTWDRDLFPDPARFQRALHDRGLRVTLNDHPADGVRAFEDQYPRVVAALGREADGEAVAFDVTDPEFRRVYLDELHRGLEELGTDFWWLDWQSGPYSKVPGVDPLWVLNHEQYEDTRAQTGDGLVLSRYAGPGSHRYPVGFSGDTIISWESLAFQPRMTAAAANIGYGWWSHDIGGHMGGHWDDELATRWVQFGVFSPILRLHSSNSRFASKEPWLFPEPARGVMTEQLRLRHRLVPYLHAMNRRAHLDGRSLVEPTYFADLAHEAYHYLDQYLFGSELLVAPITAPADPVSRLGAIDAWLPEGRWVDVWTGIAYRGGRAVTLHRDIQLIPVLLRAGGVLPLVADGESLDVRTTTPRLDVVVAGGASGEFTLAEEPEPGHWTETGFALDAEAGTFTITPADDAPAERSEWGLDLVGFGAEAGEELTVEGAELASAERCDGRTRVRLVGAGTGPVVLRGAGLSSRGHGDVAGALERVLRGAAIGYALKDQIHRVITRDGVGALASLHGLGAVPDGFTPEVTDYGRPTPALVGALTELLLAE
ncbi:TIM-barrel domain-containing protein [uncultured Tessaracoccus sp.]|uniref:glycoside hydrolase family 31 protein n=1 Tax=uncultured Tessaracoccus sp. TaxID=905023 RepID=UPI0025D1A7FD|nr:TIM-barrel domain-containing protein [uncultured Tessaracoccus sp.]